jgi:hypothetical protein
VSWTSPVTDAERENVLEILPKALNEAGIALVYMDFRPEFVERALLVLTTLEAEGKVRRASTDVWKVAAPSPETEETP